MNQLMSNINSNDKWIVEVKYFLTKNKFKMVAFAYLIWILISEVLASIKPDRYSSSFSDLPGYLKNVPPFVLSSAYLDLFIPALTLMIILILYFVFIVIRNIIQNKN